MQALHCLCNLVVIGEKEEGKVWPTRVELLDLQSWWLHSSNDRGRGWGGFSHLELGTCTPVDGIWHTIALTRLPVPHVLVHCNRIINALVKPGSQYDA